YPHLLCPPRTPLIPFEGQFTEGWTQSQYIDEMSTPNDVRPDTVHRQIHKRALGSLDETLKSRGPRGGY
ncbi:uncharacterized protein BT62DRAFT_930885, partial [Guyanagaster necrorhizus]